MVLRTSLTRNTAHSEDSQSGGGAIVAQNVLSAELVASNFVSNRAGYGGGFAMRVGSHSSIM